MDISVERERERQQQRNADRLRELAMKNRGVREDVERKRVVDPRERSAERGLIPNRGLVDRERLPERPGTMDRPGLPDRDPKAAVPLSRMVEREGRLVERDVPPAPGRAGPLERLRGLGSRDREDERTPEIIGDPDRDVVGTERIVDRDAEREESMTELVSSYKSALAELTFNSKPIITNLTIIAGENTHAAKGISSTVFNHIMEVPKEQKLPSLYLLDSIVKNIGGDYIKYFSANLPEVFCTAYRQVEPTTNPAMQHLFRTWRGVFPQGPLRLIENELQISSSAPNGSSGGTPPARPVESPIPQSGHESPVPRTGHGIHVNPKYLEAQRQRLQQGGQAESVAPESNGSAAARVTEGPNLRESSKGWSDSQLKRAPVPSRAKRDEYSNPGIGQEAAFDFDYDDYGPNSGPNNGRKSAPGISAERDEGWVEPGYFRDGDGEGFGHEERRNPRLRYGPRNGYDWRQPLSRSSDTDGYGYNRGPGPGRGGPFHPVRAPGDGSEGSRQRAPDSWLKTEEEEYVWEDMSPKLRPPQLRDEQRSADRLPKNDWYLRESDRGALVGEAGRLKRTSQDAGFGDNIGWRRNAPGVPMEQTHLAREASDHRPPKEYEERRNIQSGVGRESGVAVMDQSLGISRGSISGPRPNAGWPSQGNSIRNLSPPARTRPGPLQLSVPSNNISQRPASNVLPRAGTPPTPSNGVGHPLNSGHFESRQTSRTSIGNFGGGSSTYNSLSSAAPASGLPFQQRQQALRHPPSPTQLSRQPHHQQIPALPSSQPQNHASHLQLQHEQSNHLQGRHQMHISAQLQSSVPLGSQPQALQQVPPSQVVPPLLQSGQQSLQQALQHLSPQQGQSLQPGSQVPPQQQSQQLPGLHQVQHVAVPQPLSQLHQPQTQTQLQQHVLSAPLLPLISSQLAQSLQQLAQQQAQQSQQQSQPLAPQEQPQTSQSLSILAQALAPVANGPSAGLVQSSEGQSSNNGLLAAFLQSGIIPPQSQPISSASVQPGPSQSAFQAQPPLPSGPPPVQFSNSVGTASVVQGGVSGQMSSVVASTITQLTAFGAQPPRYTQPPLPPGPPPASTIVGSGSTTTSAPPGGVLSSSISSLLSSLVAHGVIAAPAQKNSVPAAPNSSIPTAAAQSNVNFGAVGVLPSTSISPPTTMAAVPNSVLPTSVSPLTAATQDASHSPRKPKKEAINVEFKQELLRERHEFVLEALYSDFPRQCKTCGLRFKAQDEHSKHMDWHVSRNRRQKSSKKVSRKWFVSAKEWLSGTSAAASEFAPSFFAEEPGIQEENNELVAVPADENQSACALCGELFEDFYSDETDEWMYKGAVYLNVSQGGSTEGLDTSALGPIVHMKCKTESAETATLDSIDDDDEVQPELQAADSVRMEVDGMGEDNIMPLLNDNFDMSEIKEEGEESGSRRKRTRY